MDRESRENLGRTTLALAESIARLNDPHITALMKILMIEIGRVIARNFDEEQGDRWQQ